MTENHGTREMKKQIRNGARGVSLMELLTVLAIIVTLVAMGITEFGRMDNRAVRNGAIVASKGLAMAVKMYKQEKGVYTCTFDDVMPYINVTPLMKSFDYMGITTNNCTTFSPFTYLRLTGMIKGITPAYHVRYTVYDTSASLSNPECSADGTTYYPCADKW